MGGTWRRHPVHQEVALLEVRQQCLPEPGVDDGPREDDDADRDERRAGRADDPRQESLIAVLQPPGDRRLTTFERGVGQEDEAEGRGDGQGDHHGGQHRQRIGKRQGPEERAREAFHEEDRQQRHGVDQRSVDDGAAHLERGLEDDAANRLGASFPAILAEASHDVLDVDDGIVHDDADGDHEAGQDHGVDGGATHVQDEGAGHQGQRDGHHTDERRPPLVQEGAEHHDHEHAADEQRGREIVERHLDEGRGPEDLGVDLDSLQTWLERLERLVYASRHVQRIGPGQLLDDHHEAGAAIDDRVADHRPGLPLHLGDITKEHGLALVNVDRYFGQIGRFDDGQDVAESQSLIRGIDEPLGLELRVLRIGQRRELQGFADRLLDVIERNVVGAQLIRIDEHREQLDPLAPDRNVGHARYLQQAKLDRPVGDHRKVHEAVLFRRDPDLHRPAGRRQGLEHDRRAGREGQGTDRQLETLLHQLPGMQDIGSHLEDEADRRQTDHRLGTQDVELRRAPELLLHRPRDQLFDLVRRHADAFCLNLDDGRRELREDVHRHRAKALDAEVHHRRRGGDHEESELQAGSDDPTHHRCGPPGAVISFRTRCQAIQPRRRSPPRCRRPDRPGAPPGRRRCSRC